MTELEPFAADTPAGFVAVALHVYADPAYCVGQVYAWLLYDPSGAVPNDALHVYESAGPPFDELHVAVMLVRFCPPEFAPTTDMYSVFDCDEASAMLTDAGAAGTPHAMNAAVAADAEDAPAAFVEVIVHVYVARCVKPVTEIGDVDPEPLAATPPVEDVQDTVLFDIAAPFVAPVVNAMLAFDTAPETVNPLDTVEIVGAPGVVYGVTLLDAADAEPVPAALVAVTVKVYAVPLVSPDTVQGDAPAVHVRLPGDDVTV